MGGRAYQRDLLGTRRWLIRGLLYWLADAHPPSKKQKVAKKLPAAVVLDIEGTVAPISFVTDVLFPYARAQLRRHLEETFESSETQEDIQLLREQVRPDLLLPCIGCGGLDKRIRSVSLVLSPVHRPSCCCLPSDFCVHSAIWDVQLCVSGNHDVHSTQLDGEAWSVEQ